MNPEYFFGNLGPAEIDFFLIYLMHLHSHQSCKTKNPIYRDEIFTIFFYDMRIDKTDESWPILSIASSHGSLMLLGLSLFLNDSFLTSLVWKKASFSALRKGGDRHERFPNRLPNRRRIFSVYPPFGKTDGRGPGSDGRGLKSGLT